MEKLTELLEAIVEAIDWQTLLGFLLIIAGVFAGLYLGLWWAFIGGIVAFIESFQATPVEAFDVALAFARIWFSALIGWGVFFALVTPGAKLLK